MTRYRWLLALCFLALVPQVATAGEDDDDYYRSNVDISWYSMDAGGGFSWSADFVVGGTAGQHEAGIVSSDGTISFVGGFWAPEWYSSKDDDRALIALEATGMDLIRAAIVSEGIEIRVAQETTPGLDLTEVILERAASAEGPWARVPFERRDTKSEVVALHPGATADRTWYYRLSMSAPGIPEKTVGPTRIAMDTPRSEFSLLPISPNPARSLAQISWSLPRASQVRLTVHDVLGRQVALLADGAYPAGPHGTRWNIAERGSLAPGMYFIRLQSAEGVLTRRVAVSF